MCFCNRTQPRWLRETAGCAMNGMASYPSHPPCIWSTVRSTVGIGGHRVEPGVSSTAAVLVSLSSVSLAAARPVATAFTLRIGTHVTVDSSVGPGVSAVDVAPELELALSRRSSSNFGWGSENTWNIRPYPAGCVVRRRSKSSTCTHDAMGNSYTKSVSGCEGAQEVLCAPPRRSAIADVSNPTPSSNTIILL